MSATLESREVEIAEEWGVGGGGGDVYMVGNWLLSAARVFTQESLLSTPLMAAVCWAANFIHLSPQPAISTTFVSHTLFITHLHVFLLSHSSVFLCFLTPSSLSVSHLHLPGTAAHVEENNVQSLYHLLIHQFHGSAMLNYWSTCDNPCHVFCDSHSTIFETDLLVSRPPFQNWNGLSYILNSSYPLTCSLLLSCIHTVKLSVISSLEVCWWHTEQNVVWSYEQVNWTLQSQLFNTLKKVFLTFNLLGLHFLLGSPCCLTPLVM